MNPQTQIREFCFQYLFHMQLPIFQDEKLEMGQIANENKLKESLSEFKNTTNHLFDDEGNTKAFNRIKGVLQNYNELEDKISENLKNWKVNRLSKVDHTNLLLATYELTMEKSAPLKVIINEAIEISKKFGHHNSASFINGVLDNIAKTSENNSL